MSQTDAGSVTLQKAMDPKQFPKKKKIDHEALQSSFMKIPQMKVDIARGLLDAGITESFELSGRAPEVIVESILSAQPKLATIPDLKERIAVAIYYAESPNPEPSMLKISYWSGKT